MIGHQFSVFKWANFFFKKNIMLSSYHSKEPNKSIQIPNHTHTGQERNALRGKKNMTNIKSDLTQMRKKQNFTRSNPYI